MPLMRATMIALVVLGAPAGAHAYSDGRLFEQGVDIGGGGGRRFTGSPRDGLSCEVCHAGGGQAAVDVTGFPTDGYRPGTEYAIEVAWPEGELAAFAMDVVDAAGATAGELALPAPEEIDAPQRCSIGTTEPAVALYPTADGRMVAAADACGASRATVRWTAPTATTGPVFLHLSGVTADRSGTSAGDDARSIVQSAPMIGSPPPEVSVIESGCAAGGRGEDGALLIASLLALFALRKRCAGALAAFLCVGALAAPARAVPGPDSVAVLSNANVPESVALGRAYAEARDVPDRQVCAVDAPADVTIPLDAFRTRVVAALETCLGETLARIEAIVVVRGMPLRVEIPTPAGARRASLAAALGVWRSTIDGAPILGEDPGIELACSGGGTCYAARFANPFRSGTFEPGWTQTSGTIAWQPMLVTMLHGRTYEEAARLVTSALDAEEAGGAPGEIVLMNGADGARGVLDVEYDAVISALADRGVTDVSRVPFDANLVGKSLAAFFTGTASLGETIEGNAFHPGALVDNVTSFGAVPENFEPTGESQVSIARWVAMGVAGVHGTTDEPLNNVFPSRWLIVDYVDGSTLAEAFHRRLPSVYWHNLVLGDPMLAPYAVRPVVTLEGVSEGDTIDAPRSVLAHATDEEGPGIASLALYVDGVEVARADGAELEACIEVPAGESVQILAVAQKAGDDTDRGRHRPKGWTSVRVTGTGATGACATPSDGGVMPDGAIGDAGRSDGGAAARDEDDGCGCAAPGAGRGGLVWIVVIGIAVGLRVRAGR